MRLLRLGEDGELRFEEFVGQIPRYAILSHTWGHEEIIFQDVMIGAAKRKAGYFKVINCVKQAQSDGLQYAWVDTCCIDKRSNAETSEAINSMFKWYRHAEKCYVYLEDVSSEEEIQGRWMAVFRSSRWFTRGWTLQELLAPLNVEFYSEEWIRHGNKALMLEDLRSITGIPNEALEGRRLSEFPASQRLSWASTRQTTRQEDLSYCLIGLFDVNLLPIYGEGGERAFVRLQEEVLKTTGDLSILGWYWDSSVPEDWESIFAPSPAAFNRRALTQPAVLCRDKPRWIQNFRRKSRVLVQYQKWAVAIGVKLDQEEQQEDQIDSDSSARSRIPFRKLDVLVEDFDSGNDITSNFSGIREVVEALMSQVELKSLYARAVHTVDRRKARAHIGGFLGNYGRDLEREAFSGRPGVQDPGLRFQTARFLRELAGKIANEIIWKIAESDDLSRPQATDAAKKDLEGWLSSVQPQSGGTESKEFTPAADIKQAFQEDSDDDNEELDSDLQFPNVDKVKEFLLNSRAFRAHVVSMRNWLKVDGAKSSQEDGKITSHQDIPEKREKSSTDSGKVVKNSRNKQQHNIKEKEASRAKGRLEEEELKSNRRKTRPTQGDWVLIREMDPNQPEIAEQVREQALNSDSDEDEDEMDEQPQIAEPMPSGPMHQVDAQKAAQTARNALNLVNPILLNNESTKNEMPPPSHRDSGVDVKHANKANLGVDTSALRRTSERAAAEVFLRLKEKQAPRQKRREERRRREEHLVEGERERTRAKELAWIEEENIFWRKRHEERLVERERAGTEKFAWVEEEEAPRQSREERRAQQTIEDIPKPPEHDNIVPSSEVNSAPSHNSHRNRSVSELLSGLLDFWGISFFFYDIVELFVPSIRPGYKRLRWRCSCNTVLWGDFLVEDDSDFEQLKNELSRYGSRLFQRTPSDPTQISPSTGDVGAYPGPPKSAPPGPISPNTTPGQPIHSSGQNSSLQSGATQTADSHIVNISFSPKYFEVCINIGNHAIQHYEIDISKVSTDSELFELVWDKYNSGRGFWLRRIFLRPKDVHFVMFSISRRNQYGAGIHRKPHEFPPNKEVESKRYHYLRPKTRMPVNVFLHYLHRARWNVWGEHVENTWLQRLPKKLNDSILAEVKRTAPNNQLDAMEDPNLAFGWGVHILDGPNHAVLGLILAVGVAIAFIVSGLVVGFAETQEQGFGVGSFLLVILASVMAALYFQFQDQ